MGKNLSLRAIVSRNLDVNSIFYSIPSVTSKDHGHWFCVAYLELEKAHISVSQAADNNVKKREGQTAVFWTLERETRRTVS